MRLKNQCSVLALRYQVRFNPFLRQLCERSPSVAKALGYDAQTNPTQEAARIAARRKPCASCRGEGDDRPPHTREEEPK